MSLDDRLGTEATVAVRATRRVVVNTAQGGQLERDISA